MSKKQSETDEIIMLAILHLLNHRDLLAEMLEVLQELDECAYYWSQYDVPVGIHDRIKSAIAKAKGAQP
jgi:septum formation inhibitor-activating ATPase MinD